MGSLPPPSLDDDGLFAFGAEEGLGLSFGSQPLKIAPDPFRIEEDDFSLGLAVEALEHTGYFVRLISKCQPFSVRPLSPPQSHPLPLYGIQA
jgi:hypothetical protein